MFFRLVLLCFCAVIPFSVSAQIATVRSGEHNEFTRIVIPIPLGSLWKVEQVDKTVTITIPGFSGQLDTSQIFELIPRDRVTDARSENDTLTLTLGCDCRVAPFVTRDRFVVLDIASRGTVLAAPLLEPSVVEAPAPELELVSDETQAKRKVTSPVVQLEQKEPRIKLPLLLNRNNSPQKTDVVPTDLPQRLRSSLSEFEQDALNAMQRRLAQELSTASTRGILSPSGRRSIDSLSLDEIDQNERITRSTEAKTQIPNVSRDETNNLRITSSIDAPAIDQNMQDNISMAGLSCPLNSEVDIASWADNQPFHVQVGKAREELFGEFDTLSKQGAIAFAKLYLHFGFGAEALGILSLDPDIIQQEQFLKDLAHIMEHGTAADNSTLSSLVDCKTDVALWAILSNKTLDVAYSVDPSAALSALDKLPVHLRKFIAPALSQRLLSHGDVAAASTALRNVLRLPSSLPSAAKLAQANISINEGNLDEGVDTLKDVVDDNALQSPKALITLVETRLEANQPIDPETAGLIEAYAKELRGSEIGTELRRAHVLALVKSGQFDQGFAAIQEFGGDTEEEDAVALRLQVLGEVTATAQDVVFLEYVYEQSERDFSRLPVRSKLALARRLFDLGFPAKSQEIALTAPEKPLNTERQLLLAEIELSLEQPDQALTSLIGLKGQETDLLRARAHLMAGAHQEASMFFEQANQPEAAIKSAWLAQPPDPAVLLDDPLFGSVLTLADTLAEASADPEGMLQRSDAALQESENARQVLSEFLSAPQLGIENPEK